MAGFDLVIFDCDGVLVDSERIANRVFARILEQECGLKFSLHEMFDLFVGNSQEGCLNIVEYRTGKPPPPNLATRYHDEINAELAASVVAVNGIEAVLQQLTVPFCVASSGSHEKMQLTLGKTGLLRYFENNIFSASEVARGKPYPDIYLHAATAMGMHMPHNCLVIEDSPPGVTGAVAANMTVFGYAELMNPEKLLSAGAHRVFNRMQNLLTEIENFIES